MDEDIFSYIDSLIRKAGTKDPIEIAKKNRVAVSELKGTIAGFAAVFGPQSIIGINVKLPHMWYFLGGWHELVHVFDGHIYEPAFQKGHMDGAFFTAGIDSKTLSRHERVANLAAAHVFLEDNSVYEVTGLNSPTLQQYRHVKAYQKKLMQEFESLRSSTFKGNAPTFLKAKLQDTHKKLRVANDALSDLEAEMLSVDCCRTFMDMASELGVDERIFRYKLESMRLRGFDIDAQELEHYSKLFEGVI